MGERGGGGEGVGEEGGGGGGGGGGRGGREGGGGGGNPDNLHLPQFPSSRKNEALHKHPRGRTREPFQGM